MKPQVQSLGKASVTVEDYDIENCYFENTIVTDMELGMSCISKVPVPAGVPLTDERFWQCINKFPQELMINYKKIEMKLNKLIDKLGINLED